MATMEPIGITRNDDDDSSLQPPDAVAPSDDVSIVVPLRHNVHARSDPLFNDEPPAPVPSTVVVGK